MAEVPEKLPRNPSEWRNFEVESTRRERTFYHSPCAVCWRGLFAEGIVCKRKFVLVEMGWRSIISYSRSFNLLSVHLFKFSSVLKLVFVETLNICSVLCHLHIFSLTKLPLPKKASNRNYLNTEGIKSKPLKTHA